MNRSRRGARSKEGVSSRKNSHVGRLGSGLNCASSSDSWQLCSGTITMLCSPHGLARLASVGPADSVVSFLLSKASFLHLNRINWRTFSLARNMWLFETSLTGQPHNTRQPEGALGESYSCQALPGVRAKEHPRELDPHKRRELLKGAPEVGKRPGNCPGTSRIPRLRPCICRAICCGVSAQSAQEVQQKRLRLRKSVCGPRKCCGYDY